MGMHPPGDGGWINVPSLTLRWHKGQHNFVAAVLVTLRLVNL
jgi:hypothetical protein